MGDRLAIVILKNGKYEYELYDHWGGRNIRDIEKYDKLMKGINKLLEKANGLDNFITMLVHFYRQEIAGLKPDEPYNIYLNKESLTSPDHPILVIDYRGRESRIKFVDELSTIEEIEKGTAPECFPIPMPGGFIKYECMEERKQRLVPA